MSDSSGRLTYTVDQPDVHGQGGGWQVKQAEGLQPDEVEAVLALVAPLRLEERPPEFLTEQQAAELPRRLVYALISSGAAALVHTAPAGMDASRRPDNTFTDAVLFRGFPVDRPIRWWRSSGWLTPYGPVAVSRAGFAPGARPEPADSISPLSVVEMLADSESDVDRLATFFPLLDAVAAAVRGGRRVALLVPDPDTAARWVAAVSFFAPPAFARQLTFDTWGSPALLAKRQAPSVVTAVLRAEAEPHLRKLSPAYAVFDVEHEADDESGRDSCGVPVAPTLWSRVASLAFDLPPKEVVDLLKLLPAEEDKDPGAALAAAARAYPRLAGVRDTIDRIVEETAPTHVGHFASSPFARPAPTPEPRDGLARESAPPAASDDGAGTPAFDALVAAQIAGDAEEVARALQQFLLTAAENVDVLAGGAPTPIPAPVTPLTRDLTTRVARQRFLVALESADIGLALRGLDFLVRCGLVDRGPQSDERVEPVLRRLAAYRHAGGENRAVGPLHPVTEHLLRSAQTRRPTVTEVGDVPRRSPRDLTVSLSAAFHDSRDDDLQRAWETAVNALRVAAPAPETRHLARLMLQYWRNPRVASCHQDSGETFAVVRAHDLASRPWESADFDLAPDAEELLLAVPELSRHLAHEKRLWMLFAKAGTLAVAHLAVARRQGLAEPEALTGRKVAESYVEIIFDGFSSAVPGLSALIPRGVVPALADAARRRVQAPDAPFVLRLLAAEPRMPEEVPPPRPRTLAGLLLGSLAGQDAQVTMRSVTGGWHDGSPHSPVQHLSEDEQHVRAQIEARDRESPRYLSPEN